MNKQIFRIVLLGTTGVGKSQLCNFIIKDNSNRTFEVSDSFDSHTQVPQSTVCKRSGMNIEVIDTAGCCDSGGNDDKNFKVLIEYLRKKESISLFMIVMNFADDRLNEKTREYIRLISETFTPKEFYNHLVIVFTHYPEKPKGKTKDKLDKKVNQIQAILKELVGVIEDQNPPQVYELDTETDDDENFIPKFQATIDSILLKMQNISLFFGDVCTKTIKYKGANDRIEEEKRKMEEQKKKLEGEKRKMEKEKKRMEEEEKQIQEERRKAEEERKKAEEDKKKSEEQHKKDQEEYEKRKKEIADREEKLENDKKRLKEEDEKNKEENNKILSKIEENKKKMKELQDKFDIKIRDLNSLIRKEEARQKEGIIVTVVGTILSCTLILAPIGIPMAIAGTVQNIDASQKIDKYTKERKQQIDLIEEEKKRLNNNN